MQVTTRLRSEVPDIPQGLFCAPALGYVTKDVDRHADPPLVVETGAALTMDHRSHRRKLAET